jgi:MinD-like ATPase involved in chromosome partitioning or flagellar assembly
MKLRLVTAGGSADWETALVQACQDADSPAEVIQRCYDLGDLLAVAASGHAQVALVAATNRWLDREAIDRLSSAGVPLVGIIPASGEDVERRLRQLGVVYLALTTDPPAVLIDRARAAALVEPTPPAEPASPDGDVAPADPEGAGPRPLIAVWGPKGAPGRTTMAVNLAFEAVPLVGETLLVDADTYGGSIDQKLGFMEDYPGLPWAARLASRGELDALRLWRETRRASGSGPRVLVGLPRPALWTEVRPATWENLLDLFRVAFPLTVLDLASCLEEDEELSYDQVRFRRNAVTRIGLQRADLVIAVARGDPDGLREFLRSYQDLRELVEPQRLAVVINQVRRGVFAGDPVEQIRGPLLRYVGVEPIAYVPYDRGVLDAALMAGQALREARPGSPAQTTLAQLTATALSTLGLLPDSRAGRPRRRRRSGRAPAAVGRT